jgi:protease II
LLKPTKEDEEVLLKISDIPGPVSDLHALKLDKTGSRLAVVYADADDNGTLLFKDLQASNKGGFLGDAIRKVRQVEFLNDRGYKGEWYFVVARQGESDPRSHRVDLMQIGSDDEELLFSVTDPEEAVHIVKSKDEEIVFVNVTTGRRQTRCLAFFATRDGFDKGPVLDLTGGEVFAEHVNGHFIVFRKTGHTVQVASMGGDLKGESVLFETSEFKLKDVDVFQNAVVLYGHNFKAEPEILLLRFATTNSLVMTEALRVPNELFALGKITPGLNSEFETRHVNFDFQSPIVPKISLQLDLATSRVAVAHSTDLAQKLPRVKANRVFVGDVPITMFRSGASVDSLKPPCLMVSYGVYGEVLEPIFSAQLAYLLSHGWTVAFAHIRGGGDCETWHVKKLDKLKSVDDWLSCADHLAKEYRLYAQSTSAGAAVLAAALNDVRGAAALEGVVLRMPFVDVLGAMTGTTRQKGELAVISVIEQEEWGRADIPEEAEWLKHFSALQNVNPNLKYPRFFVTAAIDDPRVEFSSVKEYVKTLRDLGVSVEFNEVSGGHFGLLGDESLIEMEAKELVFLLS